MIAPIPKIKSNVVSVFTEFRYSIMSNPFAVILLNIIEFEISNTAKIADITKQAIKAIFKKCFFIKDVLFK